MALYETVFITRQDLSETQVKSLAEDFSKIIADNGGKVEKTEFWGLRTLAYKINKSRKGHYVLFQMDAPAPALHEMERQIRLNEDIMRYMTVKIDAITEGATVVMNKDDDRSDDNKDKKEAA